MARTNIDTLQLVLDAIISGGNAEDEAVLA
jgi:hypothetical protein